MSSKLFGSLVAASLALSAGSALAKDEKKAPAKAEAKKAGECQTAKGHSKCSGNGNNNGCAGKNACNGQGQAQPGCQAAHDKAGCEKVMAEDGKTKMCHWKA